MVRIGHIVRAAYIWNVIALMTFGGAYGAGDMGGLDGAGGKGCV